MEVLGLDNIYGEQEIDNLFGDSEDTAPEETGSSQKSEKDKPEKENDETKETTEVVTSEDLFEDEETKQPESVGSEKKEDKEKGGAATEEGSDTSPKNNFYSSIANALAVDGIFPNLDDETIKGVTDAETLSEAIEKEVQARYDEGQQRVLNALKNGVEPTQIKQFENTLNYLNSLTDAQITEESEKGEELRQRIIYQDFINKGYKPAKAQQLVQRTIDAGTDIEDAKEALQSNKEYFQGEYDELLEDAQKKADEAKAERKKQEAKLQKSILEDKTLLGNMELSADIRKKAYDNISRAVYKDPETGQYMTALQKYQSEHPEDFIKYVGLFMTLTDGFKDFKSFAKAEVKKEMRKGLRELEQTLSNTRRNSDGSLNLVGGRKIDSESFIDGGFKLHL